jgi:uncharacterized protein (UPF0335 family)
MNAKKLKDMTDNQFSKFLEKVERREENDDHLSPKERQEVLAEVVRRNPHLKRKLSHKLNNDYVDFVLAW